MGQFVVADRVGGMVAANPACHPGFVVASALRFMKADTHPKNYRLMIFRDSASGQSFPDPFLCQPGADREVGGRTEYPLYLMVSADSPTVLHRPAEVRRYGRPCGQVPAARREDCGDAGRQAAVAPKKEVAIRRKHRPPTGGPVAGRFYLGGRGAGARVLVHGVDPVHPAVP